VKSINDIAAILKDLVSYRTNTDNSKKIVKASKARVVQSGRGKDYPGTRPLITYRAIAWSSPTIYSIITFRKHQVLKKKPILIPFRSDEPPFRFNLLEYDPETYINLSSIDFEDAVFLARIKEKLRKEGIINAYSDKKIRKILSTQDIKVLDYLNEKHLQFFLERTKDSKNILQFLTYPDPIFSEDNNFSFVLGSVLDDLLTIDRGVLIKIRDENSKILAITPVDGTTIKPLVDEDTGKIEGYVQEVDGEIISYLNKNDVVLFRQNITPDVYMYGYSVPPLEVVYTVALTDIFIDKGNLDYYKKGGSIPEGIIVVEPPAVGNDDPYPQLPKETLDGIQRQLQSIMMGDYTQVPILSGGKFTWIDFKGKRRDMQYRELADYVARKICAVYQVSPQDVGILGDVNRATAETMASLTKAKGLEPLISTISTAITNGIIKEFRPKGDLKFWFEEDDQEKLKEWWSTAQQQLSTGFKSINEMRMERGLSPVPWGDVPFAGLNNWQPPKSEEEQQAAGAGNPLAALFGGTGGAMGGGGGMEGIFGQGSQGQSPGLEAIMGQKSLETILSLATDENYLADDEIRRRIYKSLGLPQADLLEQNTEDVTEVKDFAEFTKDFIEGLVKDKKLVFSDEDIVLYLLSDLLERNKVLAFLCNFFKFPSTPRILVSPQSIEVSLNQAERIQVNDSVRTDLDNYFAKYKIKKVVFLRTPKDFYSLPETTFNLEHLDKFNYLDSEDIDLIIEYYSNQPKIFSVFDKTISESDKQKIISSFISTKKIKSKFLFDTKFSSNTLVYLATILSYQEIDKSLANLKLDKSLLSLALYVLIPEVYSLNEVDSVLGTNCYEIDQTFAGLLANKDIISKNEKLSYLYRILDTQACYEEYLEDGNLYSIYLKFHYFISTLSDFDRDLQRLTRYIIFLLSSCSSNAENYALQVVFGKDLSLSELISKLTSEVLPVEKSILTKYLLGEKISTEEEIISENLIRKYGQQ